jgi:hypothetical protein
VLEISGMAGLPHQIGGAPGECRSRSLALSPPA